VTFFGPAKKATRLPAGTGGFGRIKGVMAPGKTFFHEETRKDTEKNKGEILRLGSRLSCVCLSG
jgi:hypothetical protein